MNKTKLPLLALVFLGFQIAAFGATAPTPVPQSVPNPAVAPGAPGSPAVLQAAPSASPGQDLWTRDSLFGDLGGTRTTLADHGIVFAPVYTGEVLGNFMGGAGGYATASQNGHVGRGVIYEHSLDLPLDVDLSRLVPGWDGATFHANALWIAGPGLSQSYVGNVSNLSNIEGYNTVRLQELWYQQNFLKDRISLKIGQIAADSEFFTSRTASLFVNGTFGNFTLTGANLPDPHDFPAYPTAAPAVRLRVQPVDQFYAQVAVFNGSTESQPANNNGTDFPVNSESGALVMSEIGYLLNQGAGAEGLPGTYKLGSFVHTHDFTSWSSQAAGAPVSAGCDYGVYGVADQQLYAQEGRSISVFTRLGYAPPEVNAIDWYVDGGFNFTGFIPSRPKDIIGIAFSRSQFSGDYSDAQTVLHGTNSYSAETVVESTYKIRLTPWWTLQPDFQYVFTPSGIDGSHDAAVLGIRTAVTF